MDVKRFMRKVGLYRSFISGFSTVGEPLFCLCRENMSFFGSEKDQEFEALKKSLTKALVL